MVNIPIHTHGIICLSVCFYFAAKDYRVIVYVGIANLIFSVRHLPTKAIREQCALGMVTLFPSLKDPYTKKGHVIAINVILIVILCNALTCHNYISWHLSCLTLSCWWKVNVKKIEFHFRNTSMMLQATQDTKEERKICRSSTVPPNSPDDVLDSSTGGPKCQRATNFEGQLYGDACQEAISLLNYTTDRSLIFQKMRETFQHCQKLINDPDSADILSIFPRFLDTKDWWKTMFEKTHLSLYLYIICSVIMSFLKVDQDLLSYLMMRHPPC